MEGEGTESRVINMGNRKNKQVNALDRLIKDENNGVENNGKSGAEILQKAMNDTITFLRRIVAAFSSGFSTTASGLKKLAAQKAEKPADDAEPNAAPNDAEEESEPDVCDDVVLVDDEEIKESDSAAHEVEKAANDEAEAAIEEPTEAEGELE